MPQKAHTRIVAVLNLTPDSFSDGGRSARPESALHHIEQMVEQGADVIDIGAESTRPGAQPLAQPEEWARLEPVLAAARARFPSLILSVDTRNAQTAQHAIEAGADWINDVSGGDERMLEVIANASCRYVLMHSLSVPPRADEVLPEDVDAVSAIRAWAEERLRTLQQAGITADRVILDPGIGFGKTPQQSWSLLRNVSGLMELSATWLIGHSRKSFFKTITEHAAAERDLETHMVSAWLARHEVHYLRVHDVPGTRRAIAVGAQLKGEPHHE